MLLVTLFQKFKRQPNTRISFTRSFMLPSTLVSVRLTHGIIWDQPFLYDGFSSISSSEKRTTQNTTRRRKKETKLLTTLKSRKNYFSVFSPPKTPPDQGWVVFSLHQKVVLQRCFITVLLFSCLIFCWLFYMFRWLPTFMSVDTSLYGANPVNSSTNRR